MSNGMEKIPDVLIEEILERLGVKSLVRFTCVSKQWNSMIKSTYFASTHLIRAQSRNPDILLGGCSLYESPRSASYSYLRTLELGCLISKKIHTIPKPKTCLAMTGSCDGLVCVYDFQIKIYVINPATRWCRSLPRANFQQINRIRENLTGCYARNCLGFGKDTVTNKYKMVFQ
ncbi:F-box protein At2g34280 [Eutrema salsugineum]|uniref:F-box protein At2g34280 n=1 Tax=Eutrema salsugineum TaxID=72664 RepID=UPI000CECF5FF|nr:F-box protein At2g34280 [Eutrema salsugineum]